MAIIAKYSLNGNGNDALGANNLTATNVTWVNGKMNQGGSFNGVNSTCRTNNTLGINGDVYSITLLIKLNAEITSGLWAFFAQCNTSTLVTNYIYYNYNGGSRQLVFGRTRNSLIDNIITHNITLGTNKWYHLGITYDGTTVSGYINGVNIGSVLASGTGSGGGSNGFDIGTWNGGTVFFSNAIIDELTVHNTALSATDINNNYLYYNGIY